MKIGGMCFNWKVVAGLAVVGLGVWVLVPNLVVAALPLLLVAACPLACVVMMFGMRGGQCDVQPAQNQLQGNTILTRQERLAELQAQLASAQAQNDVLASEIARLDTLEAPVVREAEAVARAAERRV